MLFFLYKSVCGHGNNVNQVFVWSLYFILRFNSFLYPIILLRFYTFFSHFCDYLTYLITALRSIVVCVKPVNFWQLTRKWKNRIRHREYNGGVRMCLTAVIAHQFTNLLLQ